MKILVWKAKDETVYYNASTEEKELMAYLRVFTQMDEQGDYECCPPEGKLHQSWYEKAKKGDMPAARLLLMARRNYEYEWVEIEEVIEP